MKSTAPTCSASPCNSWARTCPRRPLRRPPVSTPPRCCVTCSITTTRAARRPGKPARSADRQACRTSRNPDPVAASARAAIACAEMSTTKLAGLPATCGTATAANAAKQVASGSAPGLKRLACVGSRATSAWCAGPHRPPSRVLSARNAVPFCRRCTQVTAAPCYRPAGSRMSVAYAPAGMPAPASGCRGSLCSMSPFRCCTSLAIRLRRAALRGSVPHLHAPRRRSAQPGRLCGAAACAARSPGKWNRPFSPCASVTARAVGAAREAMDSSV